jgi:choloylglycine hydrolase
MGNGQVYSGDVTADFKPASHHFEFATVPQEKSDHIDIQVDPFCLI